MKKFVLFCLFAMFGAISYSNADTLDVHFVTKNISITSPDGITSKYTNPDDIPEILYSSKITTTGMSILSYHGLEIMLKNNQGILFTKNPITKEVMIQKVENSKSGAIEMYFDAVTNAKMNPDTKIALSFDEKNSAIIMKILTGFVQMEQRGTIFELEQNESFKYIKEI